MRDRQQIQKLVFRNPPPSPNQLIFHDRDMRRRPPKCDRPQLQKEPRDLPKRRGGSDRSVTCKLAHAPLYKPIRSTRLSKNITNILNVYDSVYKCIIEENQFDLEAAAGDAAGALKI